MAARISAPSCGTPCGSPDRTWGSSPRAAAPSTACACPAALPGRFLKAAACMYANTPDEHFVLAHRPEPPQATVACGFSGHGFTFVPVIGEIPADLGTEGTTDRPIALFDPRRVRV